MVDTLAHAPGHGGNEPGHEKEHLLVGKVAAGKFIQVGRGLYRGGAPIDGVAHLQHALGQQVGVFKRSCSCSCRGR